MIIFATCSKIIRPDTFNRRRDERRRLQ